MCLLLYQLLGVAILLQSLGNSSSSSAVAVDIERRFLARWFRVLITATLRATGCLQIANLLAGANKSQSSVILVQLKAPNSGPCAYLSRTVYKTTPTLSLAQYVQSSKLNLIVRLYLWSLLILFQYFLFTSFLLLILFMNVRLPPSMAYP